MGIYLGIALPLFILGLQSAFSEDTETMIPYWNSLLLVYAGLFLMIMFCCLFGINMYVWAKARINYKFIFEVTEVGNERDDSNTRPRVFGGDVGSGMHSKFSSFTTA